MKLTKRKQFSFLRSYFDVLNELKTDKDKLAFLTAIINKQFLDEDPEKLNFVVNLAYQSQRHQIEKSVKGYKDKMKTDVFGNELKDSELCSTQDPCQGGSVDPCQQEKEEEKEKVKEKINIQGFLDWFNLMKKKYCGKEGKFKSFTDTDLNNLKRLKGSKYTMEDFELAFEAMAKSEWVIKNQMIIPAHFLRNDNFVKYLNSKSRNIDIQQPKSLKDLYE